jgi:Skp family chaperone for outer membrane proteins
MLMVPLCVILVSAVLHATSLHHQHAPAAINQKQWIQKHQPNHMFSAHLANVLIPNPNKLAQAGEKNARLQKSTELNFAAGAKEASTAKAYSSNSSRKKATTPSAFQSATQA